MKKIFLLLIVLFIARLLVELFFPTAEPPPKPTPTPKPLNYDTCSHYRNREAIEAGEIVRVHVYVELDNPDEGHLDHGVDEYYFIKDGVESDWFHYMPRLGFDCDITSSLFLEVWANDPHDNLTCEIMIDGDDYPFTKKILDTETGHEKVTCLYLVP